MLSTKPTNQFPDCYNPTPTQLGQLLPSSQAEELEDVVHKTFQLIPTIAKKPHPNSPQAALSHQPGRRTQGHCWQNQPTDSLIAKKNPHHSPQAALPLQPGRVTRGHCWQNHPTDSLIAITPPQLTSGSSRPPAMQRNSSTLSTQPESDMPSSTTGYSSASLSPYTLLFITPSLAFIRLWLPRSVLISPLWARYLREMDKLFAALFPCASIFVTVVVDKWVECNSALQFTKKKYLMHYRVNLHSNIYKIFDVLLFYPTKMFPFMAIWSIGFLYYLIYFCLFIDSNT